MAEVLLNGREPLDWELPALERDSRIVAGLLTEEREDPPAGRRTELLPPLGTL
jgi:hypothetical protein